MNSIRDDILLNQIFAMNTTNRTLTFVAVAAFAALSAMGVKYINRPVANADFADVGQEFFTEFTDPLKATSLSVVKYDVDAKEPLSFSVKQNDKGLWVIPSHHDYPAEAADRLARTAASFIGAKKLALQSRSKDDWGRYGVADPEADIAVDAEAKEGEKDESRGTHVSLRDAGGNPLVLLLMGAVTSFILGIGMTVTAAYIFLAVALAPALIQGGGMNPLAVHLFILYWGMLSYITPPVALGAFAAATVAGSKPMETGLNAMRLGSVIYFVPFLFVLNPALILQGGWQEIALVLAQALVGVVLIASAIQGYLVGIGSLSTQRFLQWPIRLMLIVGGLAFAVPGGGDMPIGHGGMFVLSLALSLPALLLAAWFNRGLLSSRGEPV